MFKQCLLFFVLLGSCLALRQSGYYTRVKHITQKSSNSIQNEDSNNSEGEQKNELTSADGEKTAEAIMVTGGTETETEQNIENNETQNESGNQQTEQAFGDRIPQGEIEGSQQENSNQQEENTGDRSQENSQDGEEGLKYRKFPKYKYEYIIKDFHTGDYKSQWESRDGDLVKGEYSLIEPDGTRRIVSYKSDAKSGFEADVKHLGKSLGLGITLKGARGYAHSYTKLKQYL
ncbi:uncharacterized protein LOC129725496 [Wyeomyia smithii]|uniref:uncharacterized protein LOC129725496 n=1 Tax=Wyeomyia smithii TaxID=174621 RepID=UPI002467DD74|nr:uncharacterized protein LOC129725496 [Wyeomyia smithii]